MERKKKEGRLRCWFVFLHCWCSADDRLGRLVVFGREGAGKGCWFEGKRKMLEPAGEGEKDDEFSGLSLARQKREGMALV